jgi:hypothetical protein
MSLLYTCIDQCQLQRYVPLFVSMQDCMIYNSNIGCVRYY